MVSLMAIIESDDETARRDKCPVAGLQCLNQDIQRDDLKSPDQVSKVCMQGLWRGVMVIVDEAFVPLEHVSHQDRKACQTDCRTADVTE